MHDGILSSLLLGFTSRCASVTSLPHAQLYHSPTVEPCSLSASSCLSIWQEQDHSIPFDRGGVLQATDTQVQDQQTHTRYLTNGTGTWIQCCMCYRPVQVCSRPTQLCYRPIQVCYGQCKCHCVLSAFSVRQRTGGGKLQDETYLSCQRQE